METLDNATSYILNILDLEDNLSNRNKIAEELTQTQGVNSLGNTVYRKHYVIGVNLWLSLDNNLISGEGAKFDQAFETTRRHLVWQKAQDENLLLTIPDSYKTDNLLSQISASTQEIKSNIAIGFLSF